MPWKRGPRGFDRMHAYLRAGTIQESVNFPMQSCPFGTVSLSAVLSRQAWCFCPIIADHF